MKRIFFFIAVFSAGVRAGGLDVRMIESTDRSVTLEFTPKYDALRTIAAGNDRYQLLTFRTAAMDEGKPGTPDMRFITLPLALRGTRGSVAEVISADYETVAGVNQAPVPFVSAPTKKNPTGIRYMSDFSFSTDLYPASAVSLENTMTIRGWVVGYLKMYPVQYQASTHTLKKCTRMVVRVTYGAPDARHAAAGEDSWARTAVFNYEAARSWFSGTASLAKLPAFNSVRATGQWFKLEVTDDGMYKIDATYLRSLGVDPASLSLIRDVKIFGGSGAPLSVDVHAPKDADLSQCALNYVDQNSNGKFDTDDYILFYGKGANGWAYDPSSQSFSHVINPFTASNYYLLQIATGSAKEMPAMPSPSSAAVSVTTGVGKIFFDEDKINFNQSGQVWVGAPMSEKFLSRVVTNKLTGYVPGSRVTYRYDLYAQGTSTSSFTIDESGVRVAQADIASMTASEIGSSEGKFANNASGEASVVPALTDDRSTVRLSFVANSIDAVGWINWLEILYQQQLVAASDQLRFTSPDRAGAVEYPVSGFSTNVVTGYDVTDVNNVKKIDLQLQQQLGSFRFRDNLVAGAVKEYWIGAASAYLTPKSAVKLPPTNLHGTASGADFIIITHHDFAAEGQRLKTHKEQLTGGNNLRTMVVEVDTIYNEFGNGMPDPAAIRNFLLYASQRWDVAPRYVLFFGDASFDYKGLAGIDKGWVPTYETPESNDKIDSYCMDDFFARIDTTSPTSVSLAYGRLCVRTADEARFMVDRIIGYEVNPAQDQWKNTITIVADDEWSTDSNTEYYHTESAELLANSFTPSLFEVKKIYIADYPLVMAPQGRRKPDARQAILDQVNRGTVILNFTGHGNPKVWAHESILSLDDTKSQFFNSTRLTFVVAATCDWGRFDATDVQSSAEEMMKNTQGGAIGVISAVRAVYAGPNSALNNAFYGHLLSSNPFDAIPRLGDAYLWTKNDPALSDAPKNKEKYHLLGDPTLRLAIPRLAMTIDSINSIATVSATADTLSALQKVTIKGAVRNPNMSINQTINGTALVTVFDANRDRPVAEFLPYVYSYLQPGAVLYKGENSIVNGKLEASFIVPKDISYDNQNGRISVYFTSGTTDGRGQTNNFFVGGTSRITTVDTQGPSLSIYFDSPSFHPGDLVGDQPELIVALADSSGINSAGTGIGHRIEAWVDNNPKSIDLTGYYKSKKDSYQEGTVAYQMATLDPGTHSILVKAWDVYNNSSTADVPFVVASGDGLSMVNVYNLPNPASRATTFTFQHNQTSPVDVRIKIYSVAGRLITQIDRYAVADRFVQIPWECRDNEGDALGNGVYFYKIIATTTDGKFSSEALGKLAVMK